MRWEGRRRSGNIEDRRGSGRAVVAGGGGIGVLLLILLYAFMGGDPSQLVQQLPQQTGGGMSGPPQELTAEEQQLGEFVSVVLADTEEVWNKVFAGMGRQYQEPKLVLFTGRVQSACGLGSAAMGPFYCPMDQKAYIDLSFYRELKNRFRSPGDFAQAYVIAHEVGHHVQNLLGVSEQTHRAQQRMSQAEANELSVRVELQADFYAGLWAHHAQKYRDLLEPGDIEEALRAASAIGDDNIQKQTQGHVVPDSFTHGTGEQRMRWFMKGYQTGDFKQGDTFGVAQP